MKKQDINKVNVVLNAICYAFWQAEDALGVVYREAEEDDDVFFLQVKRLAEACVEMYNNATKEEQENCHQWSDTIARVAKCETLEEYDSLD